MRVITCSEVLRSEGRGLVNTGSGIREWISWSSRYEREPGQWDDPAHQSRVCREFVD
jgi:hypothetical protein